MLNTLTRLWADKTINYSIRILIAFLGVVLPCWYHDNLTAVTPLILGVIACALTETDEGFLGRIKALILTFICFAIASFSIEILFPYPWLFAIGLFSSTFGFIMLGAIGPRYATIAFGSILIAIYTMIGVHTSESIWQLPLLLLTGAAWYAFIAIIWQIIWPMQPIAQRLSSVFEHISRYMEAKSELFHPVSNLRPQPFRIQEAQLNANTVGALEEVKQSLMTRSKRGIVSVRADKFLHVYFLAQDIHERVSSTHYRYQDLAQYFQDSDILFRFKYVMQAQAKACQALADAFEQNKPYQQNSRSILALDELQLSMQRIETKLERSKADNSELTHAMTQLGYLFNNLATVERLIANIQQPNQSSMAEPNPHLILDSDPSLASQAQAQISNHKHNEPQSELIGVSQQDASLPDQGVHSLKQMWQRIKNNLTPDSVLFRHALRLSTTLTLGYGIIQLLDLDLGFWILLTTLFVCQPNFSATRQKLTARVIGTIIGLLVGFLLLTLFPSQLSQVVFLVATGVLFFSFRLHNYGYATAFITVLVVLCFNQMGQGFGVILPRLADTLIGCGLAVLAVRYILPDWQSRRLPQVMSNAIEANQSYLTHVIGQYRAGKRDSMDYRIARRNAHNHNAALSTGISHMLSEPGKYQHAVDESFRFLTLNHALLSYISALGAHRQSINDQQVHQLILQAHRDIHHQLDSLQSYFDIKAKTQTQAPDLSHDLSLDPKFDCVEVLDDAGQQQKDLEQALAQWRDHDNPLARLVLQQLHLIYKMMPEMHELAQKISQFEHQEMSDEK
ncbi:MAG: YccS family putative transporter [Vibrio sp.]